MRIPTRRLVASLMVAMAVAVSGLPLATSTVRAAGSITALAIDSEPGDWVGRGQQLEYAPPTATFTNNPYGPTTLSLQVFAPDTAWMLFISAPGSQSLEVGAYESTQR